MSKQSLAGQNLYDEIFRHYVNAMGGGFLLVTDDSVFVKAFRNLFKHLGLAPNSIHQVASMAKAMKQVDEMMKLHKHMVVCLESSLQGKSTSHLYKEIKEAFKTRCSLICVTSEGSQERIVYLQEMGADNFIVKPVNMNNIIQKVALTIRPNNKLSQLVDNCKNYIADGKLLEASQVVNLIFKEKPDSTIGLMLKGDIHKKSNEFINAENSYLLASQQSEMFIEPLKRLATLYAETGNREKRLEYLKKLDNLSPLNTERKLEIGDTYLEIDELTQANAYYGQAVDLVKRYNNELMSATMMDIGRRLKEKDPEGSVEYMEKAITLREGYLSKDDIWMFNELGINLRKNGDSRKAISYYEKAAGVARDDGGIYYNMGMAYAELHEYRKAVESFEHAVTLTPDILNYSPQIPYNMAVVYQKADRQAEAKQYYRMCEALDQDFRDVKERLAELKNF
jgi:tetratricopeptide (TPR) repeat protein